MARRSSLAVCLALVWFQALGATAAGGPYTNSGTSYGTIRDELGMSQAEALANAGESGALNVSASSASNSPGGLVSTIGLGGTRAHAYAYAEQHFENVGSGSHSVNVRVNVSQVDVTYGPPYTSQTAGAQAYARTSVYAYFFPDCPAQPCQSNTYGYHGIYITNTHYEDGTYAPGVYNLSATFEASSPGTVVAFVFLAVVTQASGPNASGIASAQAQVEDISLG